jgi:dipeptidyl aminopeptidase/acylaminoacyl peptidase
MPAGKGPHPAVVFIHGGFWKAAYDLAHAGHLCAALTAAGAATWNLEYRRIGNPGGGWPGTLEDAVAGVSHVSKLARLDSNRVVVAGHSAGGHLALYAAAKNPIRLRGVVSLAGVADLRRAWDLRLSNGIVGTLLGGSPEQVPERYKAASPIEMLPITTPQRLVHGTKDSVVPFEMSKRFAKASKNAKLIPLEGAGHFELIDPQSREWPAVRESILEWT